MFPSGKSSYLFNGADEQEWQISHDTDTTFVVYGTLGAEENIFISIVIRVTKLQ
jgi:hypothetical protein